MCLIWFLTHTSTWVIDSHKWWQSVHFQANSPSVIESHWFPCVSINRKLLIGRRCEPQSGSFHFEVHMVALSAFKLSQKALLQSLLAFFPQRHVGGAGGSRDGLAALLKAAHQAQELGLSVGAVELCRAPLAQSLQTDQNNSHSH